MRRPGNLKGHRTHVARKSRKHFGLGQNANDSNYQIQQMSQQKVNELQVELWRIAPNAREPDKFSPEAVRNITARGRDPWQPWKPYNPPLPGPTETNAGYWVYDPNYVSAELREIRAKQAADAQAALQAQQAAQIEQAKQVQQAQAAQVAAVVSNPTNDPVIAARVTELQTKILSEPINVTQSAVTDSKQISLADELAQLVADARITTQQAVASQQVQAAATMKLKPFNLDTMTILNIAGIGAGLVAILLLLRS